MVNYKVDRIARCLAHWGEQYQIRELYVPVLLVRILKCISTMNGYNFESMAFHWQHYTAPRIWLRGPIHVAHFVAFRTLLASALHARATALDAFVDARVLEHISDYVARQLVKGFINARTVSETKWHANGAVYRLLWHFRNPNRI